jgi:thiol-disulfide isomerase/thioredoxin
MATTGLLLCLVVGLAAPADDPSSTPDDRPLAERFAALKKKFEDREKAFHDELVAANTLEAEARSKKITDENDAFRVDWRAMEDEARALIRAHPDDPDAFEGIILLPDTMRSFLDEDLVDIVFDRFLDDPRMGRLCGPLGDRTEGWSGRILAHVAAKHPDRAVRGQATFAMGQRARELSDSNYGGRDRTEAQRAASLAESGEHFARVAAEFPDVASADGSTRLGDRARAELARIANLPNLKVGKAAPEIVGEDLDGRPLRLSDHRGKVVVVCFWATWCGPCMAMVPHERELVARLEGKPFILLGVNSDDASDRDKARAAIIEKRMTWPSWWDGGLRGAIQTAYDVRHWPTVYVLDPSGVIRFIDVRGADLDKAVDSLLAEMPPAPEADGAR